VLLKGLGKLKKFIDLIGSRARDLPTSSIVPQPRAPDQLIRHKICIIVTGCKKQCDSLLHVNIQREIVLVLDIDIEQPISCRTTSYIKECLNKKQQLFP
jgi:hypothetical protein